MGGCTLSAIRATRKEATEDVKTKVIEAAERGLWPDGELSVYQKGAELAMGFKVEVFLDHGAEGDTPYEARLIFSRRSIGLKNRLDDVYGELLKTGEWIASVHVHT